MRTNIKGDIGELAVMKKYLELGYWVSQPFGDDCPYDLLVDDKQGNIKKIQVKYKQLSDTGVVNVRMLSNTGYPYKDTVDIIASYCPDTSKIYVVNLKEFSNEKELSLRTRPPLNGQRKNIHLAEDFELV